MIRPPFDVEPLSLEDSDTVIDKAIHMAQTIQNIFLGHDINVVAIALILLEDIAEQNMPGAIEHHRNTVKELRDSGALRLTKREVSEDIATQSQH